MDKLLQKIVSNSSPQTEPKLSEDLHKYPTTTAQGSLCQSKLPFFLIKPVVIVADLAVLADLATWGSSSEIMSFPRNACCTLHLGKSWMT